MLVTMGQSLVNFGEDSIHLTYSETSFHLSIWGSWKDPMGGFGSAKGCVSCPCPSLFSMALEQRIAVCATVSCGAFSTSASLLALSVPVEFI
jgi:hypothetical protein